MNTDKLTTLLGLAQAIGVAAVTFYTTSEEGSLSLKSPMFWVGLAVAILVAVKAYFTNKENVSVPGAVKAVPVVLLILACGFGLSACASYIDYGDGRYGVTKVSEQRSPFGTNGGFAVLQNCEGRYGNLGLEFTDCHDMTNYHPIYSQGQGGQVVSGALTGLGFGLGSAFSGAGGASSSAASSSVSAPGKGGH
jgi:hypothetical protein